MSHDNNDIIFFFVLCPTNDHVVRFCRILHFLVIWNRTTNQHRICIKRSAVLINTIRRVMKRSRTTHAKWNTSFKIKKRDNISEIGAYFDRYFREH